MLERENDGNQWGKGGRRGKSCKYALRTRRVGEVPADEALPASDDGLYTSHEPASSTEGARLLEPGIGVRVRAIAHWSRITAEMQVVIEAPSKAVRAPLNTSPN